MKEQIEKDKIYNCDCLEGMKHIPNASIDAIICDLPYGTTACEWDTIIPFDQLWEQYKRIRKPNTPIILFGSEPFSTTLRMSNLREFRYDWIWNKSKGFGFLNANKMPLKSHEIVSVFYKELPTYNPQFTKGEPYKMKGGQPLNGNVLTSMRSTIDNEGTRYPVSIIDIPKILNDCWHPTQKPVDLLRYLIRTYSNEGDTILDNCMGSGTTAVACIKEKRHFIGFELNKDYYDKACRRIDAERRQLSLF